MAAETQWLQGLRPRTRFSDSPRGFAGEAFLPACTNIQQLAHLSFCVPPSHTIRSTGILTRFPSATAFALALGSDSPWEDYLYPGNLGFSANRFFTCFIVTHVSIITSLPSTALYNAASAHRERSPTTPQKRNPKLRYHA